MNETTHITHLRAIARWCLEQRKGILTPTGRKKKLPTYFIVKCDDCNETTLTSSKVAKAERFKCQVQRPSLRKTNSPSRPRTEICRGETQITEEIAP